MNSTKRISLNLGWGGSSSSSNNNNNSSSSTAAAASPASTSLAAPVSPLLVPPSSPGGGGFVGGFGGGISSASGRTSPQPSSFANEPQNVLWAGPAPLDREDLHKQLRSLETLLQQLGEYRLLLASLAKTEHKLAKAAKDVLTGSTFANAKDGGLMGSPEVIYHGLRSASNLYESLSEVTSKHAKTTSKEIVDLNDTLAKHFKRVSKLERAHDAHVMEYDAKIKQSGLKYEKAIKGVNRKESGMVVGEKHEKWIGQLKSLGENIAQANDSHTHEITRIQTLALLYTSTCLTTLASDQFTATAEGIKKTSPHLGDVGIWRAYAEARWVEGKSILDMELRPKGEPVAVAAAAAVVPVAASAAPAETESLRGPAESITAVAVLPAAAAPPSPRVTEEVQTSRSWEDDTELKRIEAREKAQHEEDLALAAAAAADALRSAQAERKKEQQKQQQQSLEVPRDASNGTSQPSSPRTSQASPSKSAYRPLPTTSSSSSSLDLKPPERPFANESSSPSDRPPSRQSSVDQSFRPDLLPPPSPALSSSSSRPLPTRSQDSVRSIHTLERQQIQQAKANGYLYQQQQTATAVERGSTSSRSSSSRFGGEESSPDLGGPTTPMGSWPTSSGAAHGGGGGLLRGDPPGGGRPKKSVSIDPSPSEVIPDVDYFSRRQQEEEEAAAAAAREMQLRERERERERDQQLMAEAAATRDWEAAERQRAHLMQQQQEEREREMERQRESIAISEARERERRERERERQIAEGSRIREMKGRFEDNRRYPSPPSPQPIVPSGAQLGRRVSLLSQHFDVPPSSTSSSNSGGYRPASPSTSVISASSAGQLHRPRPVSTQSYYPPQSVMSSSPHVRGARPHPASSSSMDRIAQLEPTRPLVLSASTRAARHSSFPLPGPYGSRNLASSIHHYTQQQAQRDARLNSDGDGGVGFFREEYDDDKGAEWERHQQYLAREESVHEGDLRFVSPPGSASGMGPSRWP